MKEKDPAKLVRQSNFELLRIVAIIMIIAHHIAFYGGFEYPINAVSMNRLWVQFLRLGGKIGVDLFVLISGYFLISSDRVRISRVLRLWLQLFTYSASLYLVFSVLVGSEPFSVRSLIKSFLPLLSKGWWFANAYFVLYLLHPYINRLLLSFDRARYKRFLALLLCIWCVIPTFTRQLMGSNDLLLFIVLYSVAGYYRLHGINVACRARTFIALSMVMILLTFLSAAILDVIGTRIAFAGKHATWFYEMYSLPVLLASVLMFMGFDRMEIKPGRAINTVASASFGTYLIHENAYCRPFLWKDLFNAASYADSGALIPYTLMMIAAVFASCTVIELIRKRVLEDHYLKLLDRAGDRLSSLGNRIAKLKLFEKL